MKFRDIQRASLTYQKQPDIGEETRMASVGRCAILFRMNLDAVRIEVTHGGRNLAEVFDLTDAD